MKTSNPYPTLTALLSMYLMLESIDAVQQDMPKVFTHSFKNKANMLRKELESRSDFMFPILLEKTGLGEEELFSVMNHQKSLMYRVSKSNPSHYHVIEKIIELYNNDPEKVAEAVGIQIIE